jgi:hypothetical protein
VSREKVSASPNDGKRSRNGKNDGSDVVSEGDARGNLRGGRCRSASETNANRDERVATTAIPNAVA